MTLAAAVLWNEPNNLSHWDFTLDPQWETFARMCRYAAGEIRSQAPHLPIVLGGVAPLDSSFVELVMRRHGLEDVLDHVGVHAFPFDWHLWSVEQWPEIAAMLRRQTSRPLWITEIGMSSFGAEEVQVIGLRKTLEMLDGSIQQAFWYSLFDLPTGTDANTRHQESEGSSYYRHFYFGLLDQHGQPKLAARHFPPELGICQWLALFDREQAEATATWLRRLGVKKLHTGLSWADWHVEGAQAYYDDLMRLFDPFEVTVTFCFTPPSRGVRPSHTSPPVDLGEFAYFCGQMVRRYT